MQDMRIALALQELAEGCTGDTVLIRTVDDNLVLFVERLQRLTEGGEMERTRDMLGLVGPLTQRHHQAEVVLAIQHLLQLLVTDRSHTALLSSASLSQWARLAPAS